MATKMLQTATDIVDWMNDYASKAKRRAWIVGVSGGVDSGAASTLCAMTGLPTHVVVIPCESKPDGIELAMRHIKWLQEKFDNIVYHQLDLTSTFEAFAEECCHLAARNYFDELGFANAKSRLRMMALYHVATCVGGLVVGTGNKVEDYGVGFFTKYGDGGVDIAPIADLYKSEVRQLCRELHLLPEICEAVPVDGLWQDNRTDESQLGATYEELEWAMDWLADGKDCYSTVLVEGLTPRQKEVLSVYNKWHSAAQHKLNPIPTWKRSTP